MDNYANWKHWAPDQFLQFRPEKATYFDWHVKRATGQRSGPLKILEVGFGNGDFLGWARKNGHAVTGLELSDHLVKLALNAGITAYKDIEAIPIDSQFDLIVAFDVLEHIPPEQVQGFLLKLKDLLKPEGTMLFRFPNAESPLGSFYQNGDITHVNPLGVSKMLQLCASINATLLFEGDMLPLNSLPLRRLPRATVAKLLLSILQLLLGPLILGHSIRIAANELVVLGRLKT